VGAPTTGSAGRLTALALKRRCPMILEDPSAYDDDLVRLCMLAKRI
jgi:hypothetical protein